MIMDFGTKAPAAVLLSAVAPLVLAGCGLIGIGGGNAGDPEPRIQVTWVSVAMLPGANENWPVPVELVRVDSEALVQTLLQTNAGDWFFGAAGENFRLANPGAVFDSWEIVPGTSIAPVNVARHGRYGGVLFCGTRDNPPAVRVAQRGWLQITVSDTGCAVQ